MQASHSISSPTTGKIHVLIPAAGIGTRMGEACPKQYLLLNGKPLIQYCLEVFLNHPAISDIHVVLSADDIFWSDLNLSKERIQVWHCGGATRSQTVLNGLLCLTANDMDWVLVHDAARPGLNSIMLERLLQSLVEDPVGGLLALPVADTLKLATSDMRVISTQPRTSIWQAQTPQMFRYGLLKQALSQTTEIPTDEAQAIEALGLRPKLVLGSHSNFKVTYPEDMHLMSICLQQDHLKSASTPIRTGFKATQHV